MKKKKILAIAFIAVAVVLTIVGWVILPDSVAVKISMEGILSNYLPKSAALLLSLAVTALGSILYMRSDEGEKNSTGGIAVAIIGIVSFFVTFAFNGVF